MNLQLNQLAERERVSAENTSILHNLQPPLTAFIGRERELADLNQLVTDSPHQIIIILGPGGMGKTHLSLELGRKVAMDLTTPFPDGIFFVALDALSSTDAIAVAILKAIGIQVIEATIQGQRRQLRRVLSDKRMFLILDNAEHLISGFSALGEILQTTLDIKLLITSREKLHLPQEKTYLLSGLDFNKQNTAQQLFVHSAKRIRYTFSADTDEAVRHINYICELLGGMPLALSMAAAWVDVLPLHDIVAEIQQGFTLLETHLDGIPNRHRSMHAILELTWRHLSDNDQHLLSRLTVFRGGFSVEAAKAVTGVTSNRLESLVNRSLLQIDTQPQMQRYILHPLIRQFAADKLTHTDEVTARVAHCDFYCLWLGSYEEPLQLSKPGIVQVVEQEYANLRAAWYFGVEARRYSSLNGMITGWAYFLMCIDKQSEMVSQFQHAIETFKDARETPTYIRLLAKLESFSTRYLHQNVAYPRLLKALATLNALNLPLSVIGREKAYLLLRLGEESLDIDVGNARDWLWKSFKMSERVSDEIGKASALEWIAFQDFTVGDFIGSATHNREALLLMQAAQADYQSLMRSIWMNTALLSNHTTRIHLDAMHSAIENTRQDISEPNLAHALYTAGQNLGRCGYFTEGLLLLQESEQISAKLYAQSSASYCRVRQMRAVLVMVYSQMDLGNYDVADQSIERLNCLMLLEPELTSNWSDDPSTLRGLLALARGQYQLAELLLDDAMHRKSKLWVPAFRSLIRGSQALIAGQRGHVDVEQKSLFDCVSTTMEHQHYISLMTSALPFSAAWYANKGKHIQSVELHALASTHPMFANSRWYADVVGNLVYKNSEILSPDVILISEERGRSLDPWETAKTILYDLSC